MQLYEKKPQRIFYVLYDAAGDPRAGIADTDLIFKYAKSNQDELTVKILTSGPGGNFGELGHGFYWTDMLPEEVDTLGEFAVLITDHSVVSPSPGPVLIDKKHLIYQIVPEPIVASGIIPTCVVFGNVKDLGGDPSASKMKVITQILKLPNIVNANFISAKAKEVYTDEDGFFKVKLAIGAIVRLEIAEAGVRRQFEVPNLTSVNIVDLPSV